MLNEQEGESMMPSPSCRVALTLKLYRGSVSRYEASVMLRTVSSS